MSRKNLSHLLRRAITTKAAPFGQQNIPRRAVERALAPVASDRLTGFDQSSNVTSSDLLHRMIPPFPEGVHASVFLSRQSTRHLETAFAFFEP